MNAVTNELADIEPHIERHQEKHTANCPRERPDAARTRRAGRDDYGGEESSLQARDVPEGLQTYIFLKSPNRIPSFRAT
jgi:hypothetical protein